MATDKYNILFIVTDQEQAHPTLPPGFKLPNHDRLKKLGVTFNNFQVTTTLCTPSRACMYTGTHTAYNGMFDNCNLSFVGAMSTKIPTLGDMFREQGYETAYKGKWHLAHISYEHSTADEMEPYGFSAYQTTGDTHGLVHEGAQRDAAIAKESIDWLSRPERRAQPWLLAVNFINPHDIMFFHSGDGHDPGRMSVAVEPNFPPYGAAWDVDLPQSFEDDLTTQPAGAKGYHDASKTLYGTMDRDNEEIWKRHINYYLNCLLDVDQQLGLLLDGLEDSGQLHNTIIVYTSDHGEMAGAHGFVQKGMALFKELLNVPLIVVHPDGPQGASTAAVASAIDLIPTCLEWTGLSLDEIKQSYPQLVGQSFANALSDPGAAKLRGTPSAPGPGTLFTFDTLHTYDQLWFQSVMPEILEIDGTGERLRPADEVIRDVRELFNQCGAPDTSKRHMIRGIFDGQHKLIRYFSIDNYNLPETVDELFENNDVGLYDLIEDPHEMNNLAARRDDYEPVLDRMNRKLNALTKQEIGADLGPYQLQLQ